MAKKIITPNLSIGDVSINGQVTVLDEDRLCYVVRSVSNGATGVRTISKALLQEYIDYFLARPTDTATEAREALKGKSEIDKFEYGYTSTLKIMAEMCIKKHMK